MSHVLACLRLSPEVTLFTRQAQAMPHVAFQRPSPYTLGTTVSRTFYELFVYSLDLQWFKRWTPTLSIWAVGAGTTALFVRVALLWAYTRSEGSSYCSYCP